jgi:hypothetical protein
MTAILSGVRWSLNDVLIFAFSLQLRMLNIHVLVAIYTSLENCLWNEGIYGKGDGG